MKFEKIIPYMCCLFFQLLISQTSSIPPTLSATGNQIYNPQTDINIATNFSITAGGSEPGQVAVYFQISEGYDYDVDILKLKNPSSFPNIKSDWDNPKGKLTLTHITPGEIIPYPTIKNLVLDVIFNSSDTNPLDDKKISISVGDANYLPLTGHYYQYIPWPSGTAEANKKWTDARSEAERKSYYGLKGYLATLIYKEEGEIATTQTRGNGWIGGADSNQEGKWEWVTGPEGRIHFWDGNYLDGVNVCDNLNGNCTSVNDINGNPYYHNWATREPNDYNSSRGWNEDYAHVYRNNGKWNDYPNDSRIASGSLNANVQGYIIEYGGSPGDPVLNITDVVELKIPRILSAATTNDICGSGSATLNATTNSMPDPLNGVEVQWWDSLINGTLLATGNSFTTPNLNSTTIFYAVPVKNDGTTSYTSFAERTPYEVKVYDKPVLNTIPAVEQESNVFNLNNLKTDLSANSANEIFEFHELGPTPGSLGTKITDIDNYIFNGSSTNNEKNIIAVVTNQFSVGISPPCNERTLIKLRVGACDIPTTFPVIDELVCETSTDPLGGGQDGFETFDKAIFSNIEADLKVAEPLFDVFGTEITFYRSDADATAGAVADRIDKTVDYTTSAGDGFVEYSDRWEQELWIRVENTTFTSTCFDTKLVGKLIVNKLPELTTNYLELEQDNTIFNLNNLRPNLSANFASETFEFYDSNGTLITNPDNYTFTGTTGSNEENISVLIKPVSAPSCEISATVTIRLGACDIPTTFPVIDEVVCETSTDPLGGGQDGFETFDKTVFSDIEADLKVAEPLFNVFGTEITFYRSDAQATAGAVADRIDKTVDYTTSAGDGFVEYPDRWEQELWVRVENTTFTSACFDTKLVGKLIINKLPELLTTTIDFNQCNTGTFNLSQMEEKISINYLNETFTFEDALGNPISNNYTIPTLTETVYANISTNPSVGTSCPATTRVAINLAWSTTIIPPTYVQKEVHKVSSTGALTGQGQNGIESFDKSIFSEIESELILAEPFFAGKTFSFYRTQNNALNFFAKIDKSIDFTTNPSNDGFTFNATENRWEQEIWVYIEDDITAAITTCFGLYQVGTLYIEKRPVFYDVADQELCDDAPDELDTYSIFDTSALFNEFTINPSTTLQQNPSLFDVQYSYIDDSGSAVVLDPNLPVNFNSNTQDVTVTLTNKTTNSSSTPGQSEGIIKFRVYKQPVAYPSDPAVAGIFTIEDCDDVASGSDADLETLFDITNIKDILLTDPSGTRPVQLSSDFDFVFTDGSGNPVTLTSDYRAKSGDQINVTITNPLSTLPNSCEETIIIEFKVNPLPSYDMSDDTIVCLNPLPGQPVEIGTSNWNGGTDPLIYEYSWTFSGDPLFIKDTPTIGVEKGGVYTVVVTDAVTRCTRTKTITVTESEMASLDRDDDGNVDDLEYEYFVEKIDLTDDNTNTITIKNIADLGIGDYEFSIDDSFGPYQDDPTFENVKPGVHTIYIRDKNSYYTYDYGCGIAQVDVSIIGYKKYFTPNGDGINETWKILGINSAFNAKSKVYIFDRYGKLLKQLDPLSDGWDGTYLGKPMPATDYWFRTYLEDGREFKGHFSLIRGKF